MDAFAEFTALDALAKFSAPPRTAKKTQQGAQKGQKGQESAEDAQRSAIAARALLVERAIKRAAENLMQQVADHQSWMVSHGLADYQAGIRSSIRSATRSAGLIPMKKSQVDFNTLPRIAIATSIKIVFDAIYENADDSHDPLQFQKIVEFVEVTIKALNYYPSIQGGLQLLCEDKKQCKELAETLILMLNHPGRASFLALEPDLPTSAMGSLKETMALGRGSHIITNLDLMLAVEKDHMLGRFTSDEVVFGRSQSDAGRSASSNLPPYKTIINSLFTSLDLNGDGQFEVEEARELLRSVASRPLIGSLIVDAVVSDPKNAAWASEAWGRDEMILLIPKLFEDLIKKAPQVTQQMWQMMDINNDGHVPKAEFCETFPSAFRYAVWMPAADMLNNRVQKLLDARMSSTMSSPNEVSERGHHSSTGVGGFFGFLLGRKSVTEATKHDSSSSLKKVKFPVLLGRKAVTQEATKKHVETFVSRLTTASFHPSRC